MQKLLTFYSFPIYISNIFCILWCLSAKLKLTKYIETLYLISREWYYTIGLPLESWLVSRLLHLRSDAACASLILILSMWDECALTLFIFILLLLMLLKAYVEWFELSDVYVLLISSRKSLSNNLLFIVRSLFTIEWWSVQSCKCISNN